ncbi:hypothetical protein ATANTOWER_023191 [Ataeniobius toweri]|uniref:Uncharacterized protein n=1 Tax=Ataeniobius toweri TaxID=208326 RepID=A0ABU7BS03_9TELE|nr:hypothetical protein [Ataeniobius toweri]
MVLLAKCFSFSLIRPQDMFTKIRVFVTAFTKCSPSFMLFWSNGFYLTEWLFSSCQYRTCFTVDNNTFSQVPAYIFIRSFGFVPGFDTHILHITSGAQNLSPS